MQSTPRNCDFDIFENEKTAIAVSYLVGPESPDHDFIHESSAKSPQNCKLIKKMSEQLILTHKMHTALFLNDTSHLSNNEKKMDPKILNAICKYLSLLPVPHQPVVFKLCCVCHFPVFFEAACSCETQRNLRHTSVEIEKSCEMSLDYVD